MSDHITGADLNKEEKYLKEKVYEEASKKRNTWIVDVDICKEHNITFMESALFGMISQLQCVKDGFCRAKNYYFLDALGVSDEWIRVALKKLSSKSLIWYHIYNTKNGKRRHIVTASSIRSYQRYLVSKKSWSLLKKFQKEFAVLQVQVEPTDPSSSPSHEETQVIDNLPTQDDSHSPPKKSGDGPPKKSGDAINTTYLPDNKNDGTCKGSDDPSVAVSFEERMRKELEYSYSKADVDIMMQWYEMQTENQKSSMKKPIACVINAYNEGYAQEEVASRNQQVAQQMHQHEKKKLEVAQKKTEEEQNRKLAFQLIDKFSHMKVWSHDISEKRFSIKNEGVEKGKDENNLIYCVLPSGKKLYGKNHAVIVNFEMPHAEFKKTLKDFFLEAEWKSPQNSHRETS